MGLMITYDHVWNVKKLVPEWTMAYVSTYSVPMSYPRRIARFVFKVRIVHGSVLLLCLVLFIE